MRCLLNRLAERWARRRILHGSTCLVVTSFEDLKTPLLALKTARAVTEHLLGAITVAAARRRTEIITLQIYAEVVEREEQLVREQKV